MISKNFTITDTTDGLPNPRRIWAVVAASLALIMSVLDANIINVVLPTLSREFGTSPSTTIWVMNAYQLAITVSLLSFSSAAEMAVTTAMTAHAAAATATQCADLF